MKVAGTRREEDVVLLCSLVTTDWKVGVCDDVFGGFVICCCLIGNLLR